MDRTDDTAQGGADAPLVAWVGFAGHRRLAPEALAPRLVEVFAMVAAAFEKVAAHRVVDSEAETVAEAHAAIWPGSRPRHATRLLTGVASGADAAAIAAWRKGHHGEVHAVFPFADREEPDVRAWTDVPGKEGRTPAEPNFPVLLRSSDGSAAYDGVSVLDGEAARAETPPRQPHLEQSRWIVSWSDLLVVVWDGKPAIGEGGTGDTVALAIAHNVPVVWVDIDDGMVRLLTSEAVRSDASPAELGAAVARGPNRDRIAPATDADTLARVLLPRFAPPNSEFTSGVGGHDVDEETEMRHDHAAAILGESGSHPAGSGGVVGRIARRTGLLVVRAWRRFNPEGDMVIGRDSGAPGATTLAAPVPPLLPTGVAPDRGARIVEAAFREADRRATMLGDLHRGVQVLLLLFAVAAVVFGTSAAVFPGIKPLVVTIELFLVVSATVMWKYGFIVHNHRRWGDVRRLAERLRAFRATHAIGVALGESSKGEPSSWTEWQVGAMRRRTGPPIGIFSSKVVRAAFERVRIDPDGIIRGQAIYHERNAARLLHAHQRLEAIEKTALVVLLLVLGGFLALDLLTALLSLLVKHGGEVHLVGEGLHHLLASVVLWVSATVPTIASACLAAEAKLGFEENGRRSRFYAAEFSSLDGDLAKATSLGEAREILQTAIHILLSDIDWWKEASVHRRIATF